jgi:glycerate 2-kinase
MNPNLFQTHSLASIEEGAQVREILAAAIGAVDPAMAVHRNVKRSGDRLAIGEHTYPLSDYRRVLVAGAGKAGAPMAKAIEPIMRDHLDSGIVIVKGGYAGETSPRIKILEAGHPVPDRRGVEGTEQIVDLLKSTGEDDLVICLISGGGSALLTLPAEGIQLEQIQTLTSDLLASGADINEINTLRKHLDQVKGGKFARLAAPARVVSLILSDVVGDPLDVIASGPTVPDTSTFQDAIQVLSRYDLQDKAPLEIIEHLKRGLRAEIAENPRPGDPIFKNVQNAIIGGNLLAAQAAVEKAGELGFNALLLTTYLQGEARQVGRTLAAVGRQLAATGHPLQRPACVVIGGETTVTIQGDGLGGRNQEMALGAVEDLAGLEKVCLVCLASDGGDGPTDAAGAIVTGETFSRAIDLGLNLEDYLARNDSYHFFKALDDLLVTGPTRTNVNDLAFLFAF